MKVAIIDLGTNTFNLLVAKVEATGEYRMLYQDKIGVKLGKGGINTKQITPEAFQRGIDAIEKHLQTIDEFKVDKIKATATSGIRSTQNGKEFIETLRSQFQLNVEVIDGNREAELIFTGVKQVFPFHNKPSLILDIGGGSNEFILANNEGILWKKSYNLGIARLLDRFSPSDPMTRDEVKAVNAYLDQALTDFTPIMEKHKPQELVGCSGTFDTFRALWEAAHPNTVSQQHKPLFQFPEQAFAELYNRLIVSSAQERLQMKGMEAIRVEMIVLAAIFVKFTMDKYGLKQLFQSDYAIKEGVLKSLA
jgi:exopolyphosphatase/guanosine-5'-triphosphate,3'-diphosphate pyrophosphatase